jgi:methylase of polypeptide subunit release factors
MATTHLSADRAAARTLGEALRALDYSEGAVSRLLGDDAYAGDPEDGPVAERRLPQTELGTVIRALFLQLPVSKRAAGAALGRRGLEALSATGLADVGAEVVPRSRILPVGDLLVASDDFPSDDVESPPDFVAAYTPTSRLLDSLTPRRRVGRALDVGTGSGVQALLTARHARLVVATDVNESALAYTELNAALNGFENVECRCGSLFEPAGGEHFDLITCNAPYVVSPENRWAYRDGGLQADEVSERVVKGAADHLADGGFATLLVSWIAADEDEPDERPLAWTDTIECDSWILPIWGSDALGHAATWNDHLADDRRRFGAALDTWTDYLARLGVRWVSEGAVLLHRREGRQFTVRVDEVEEDDLEEAGAQIERAFAARARLAELKRRAELLDAKLSLAAPVRLEHELGPRGGRVAVTGASLELDEGTHTIVEGSPRTLELVAMLDGTARLGDVLQANADRLGLSETETSRLRRDLLDVCRELLELGALRFD